jgi:c-di-GMP-binding flagellar brake protein YcgR
VIRHVSKAELMLESVGTPAEPDSPHQIEGRVLDLSEGGASLFAEHEVAAGQRCRVKLKILDGGIVESTAEIRWVTRKEARDGYAVGVRFVDLDDINAQRLEAFLGKLDATLGL